MKDSSKTKKTNNTTKSTKNTKKKTNSSKVSKKGATKERKDIVVSKKEEEIREIEKDIATNNKKEEEKDNRKKWLILLLLLLLLFVFLFYKLEVWDIIVGTPTAPIINKIEGGWQNSNVVEIDKDSTGRYKIKYYLYCITDSKDPSKCKWKKTYTKNITVDREGKSYIYVKAVDEKDREGKISDPIEVFIDTVAPIIVDVKKEIIGDDSVKITVDARDKTSGIAMYYFKLDDGEFISSKNNNYTFSGLEKNREYIVTVKVVDKAGNEKEVALSVIIEDKDDNNEPKEELEVPELSLDGVPRSFIIGTEYQLPTSYKFGKSGGHVVCYVDSIEKTSTKDLLGGKHTIECIATSNTGIEVRERKEISVKTNVIEEQVWDGWITMNLYYPENSTNWQWRLGRESVVRDGSGNSGWEPYTGPITVRLTDVENVYIKYTLNDKEVIVAPNNKLVADIQPSSYKVLSGKKTMVKISYTEDAETKEYQINGGSWQEYKGAFYVGEDTLITARVRKTINGKLKSQYDYAYISLDTPEEIDPDHSGSSNPSTTPTSGYSPDGPWAKSGRDDVVDELAGPIITINPTSLTKQVTVTLTTAKEASDIYYKVGSSENWKKYTGNFTVTTNTTVYAYYVTKDEGRESAVSNSSISNIKKDDLPYVRITSDHSLSNYTTSEVITISGTDYDRLEYSFDGVVYVPYTEALTITNNCRIYAKGTNSIGSTIEYLDINNIGNNPPEVKQENLTVSINANPSKSSVSSVLTEVKVSITYDKDAEEKYYTINDGAPLIYTGEFTIHQNSTIKAYAKNSNGYGEAVKQIDYLTTGISSPVIKSSPSGEAYDVTVTISYDQTATKKLYRINGGEYKTYTGPFKIYDNDTTITAYNENSLGHSNTSTYKITNIISMPNYTLVDYGDYFILKLNYPEISAESSREYKWTPGGAWKTYDPSLGVLLVKSKYKDELISSDGAKVNIDGKDIIYEDHYYIVDDFNINLAENLFMRWDFNSASEITFNASPKEATDSVKVSIDYGNNAKQTLYKLFYDDGTQTNWTNYSGPITIKKNNTIIYAKKTTSNGSSDLESYEVENIDTVAPTVSGIGDLSTEVKRLYLQIVAEDNFGIETVAWAKGEKAVEYFAKEGNFVKNNSSFKIDENGKYTLYAIDTVGNEVVNVVDITNINPNLPNIYIDILNTDFTNKTDVKITYEEAGTKEYKVGTNGTYQEYTDVFTIESDSVKDLFNDDGSITIYARTVDEDNVKEVTAKIYNLDNDYPDAPVISAKTYPKVTSNGIETTTYVTIDYDNSNKNVTNEYSIDNGQTWKKYTKPFIAKNTSNILARTTKNDSKLQTSTNKTTEESEEDILGINAYDYDSFTYQEATEGKTMYIDSSVEDEYLEVYVLDNDSTIELFGENGKRLDQVDLTTGWNEVKIPRGIDYLTITSEKVYEVELKNINNINYPKIAISNEGKWNITKDVMIAFTNSSYTHEYSIDLTEWKTYEGAITLDKDATVYARELDSNGKVITSATYKVWMIDPTEPTINLDGFGDSVTEKDDQKLPSSYTVDESKSSGSTVCYINDLEYTTTKDLAVGDYTVNCTVTTGAGNSASVSKTFRVKNPTAITYGTADIDEANGRVVLPYDANGDGDIEVSVNDTNIGKVTIDKENHLVIVDALAPGRLVVSLKQGEGEWYSQTIENKTMDFGTAADSNSEAFKTALTKWGKIGTATDANWYGTTSTSDSHIWQADGTYTIVETVNTNNYTGYYYKDGNTVPKYKDIIMDFDMTTTDGDDDIIGIMTKFKPESTSNYFSGYLLLLDAGGYGASKQNGLWRGNNKQFSATCVAWTDSTSASSHQCTRLTTNANIKWARNKWQHYKVQALGNTIKVYRWDTNSSGNYVVSDSAKIFEYTDTSNSKIASGTYGFWTYSQAYAQFKNFVAVTVKEGETKLKITVY